MPRLINYGDELRCTQLHTAYVAHKNHAVQARVLILAKGNNRRLGSVQLFGAIAPRAVARFFCFTQAKRMHNSKP